MQSNYHDHLTGITWFCCFGEKIGETKWITEFEAASRRKCKGLTQDEFERNILHRTGQGPYELESLPELHKAT